MDTCFQIQGVDPCSVTCRTFPSNGSIPLHWDHTRPKREWIHQDDVHQEWMCHESGNQSYPWWQQRTSSASGIIQITFRVESSHRTYQEGAQEDETNKVTIGYIGPTTKWFTFVLCWNRITFSSLDTAQHDCLPCLTRSTHLRRRQEG